MTQLSKTIRKLYAVQPTDNELQLIRMAVEVDVIESNERTTTAKVLDAVVQVTGIPASMIRNGNRKRAISDARHIYCYLADKFIEFTTQEQIGAFINRDHASIIHGKRKIANLLKYDPAIREAVSQAIFLINKQ